MASDVEVCNLAMTMLGAETISSLTQASANARRCARVYIVTRDAELRRHPWNFARARASLAEDSTAPAFGYDHRYQLPSDFLRLHPSADALDWQIEAGYVLTDDGAPLEVTYIRRVDDASLFDALFVEALAAKIAYLLAEEITQSNTKKAEAKDAYKAAIQEAKRANAIERVSDEPPEDPWITARL
jgi:hypothetical protein